MAFYETTSGEYPIPGEEQIATQNFDDISDQFQAGKYGYQDGCTWDIEDFLQKIKLSRDLSPPTEGKAKYYLSTLANEILLMIMKQLDPVTSTCLSLAARRFYGIHKALHPGIILLRDKNETGTKLLRFLHGWMGVQGFVWRIFGVEFTRQLNLWIHYHPGAFVPIANVEYLLMWERMLRERGIYFWHIGDYDKFLIRFGRGFSRRVNGHDFEEMEDDEDPEDELL
ncbi:hypothetical protein HYFRA_00000334 [Hymenoscyphus fraxineus]|uniref:F-box domain-containing protein n=1 Tax=Hymenoscyphus fraxineus TaxID=746836 RepID=A0A9N9L3N0_9HELO|nr:hypothetical protein HYFRA_00000334 [Hymenoscyphus fraxineus]